MRFPKEITLLCIRWYAAYPLSNRKLEEMMQERGVSADHARVSRWAIKFLPMLEKLFRKHECPIGTSWRMGEAYIKVNGAGARTCTVQWARTVPRSTFFCTPNETRWQRAGFKKRRFAKTETQRRSRWARVVLAKRP